MKKIILLLFSFFIFQTTQAQFWKKIVNRIDKKTNQTGKKVEEKIDRKVENVETDIEVKIEKKAEELIFGKDSTEVLNKKETNDYPNDEDSEVEKTASNVYEFTHEVVTKIKTSENNKTFYMSYLLNPNQDYMGLTSDMGQFTDEASEGESTVVMDGDNVNVFVDAQGMKLKMPNNMMKKKEMENPTDRMMNYDYTNLTKTGNTKTILGATCYEYVISDKDTTMIFWVAPGIQLPNWFIQNKGVVKGYILEYAVDSPEININSEVTEIRDHIRKVINPKEYRKF